MPRSMLGDIHFARAGGTVRERLAQTASFARNDRAQSQMRSLMDTFSNTSRVPQLLPASRKQQIGQALT